MKLFRMLMVIMATIAFTTGVQASVIFTNFGQSGNLFQAGSGIPLTGYTTPSSFTGFVAQAFAFTPTVSFTLAEIDIALSHVSGTNDGLVSLWTDSGGSPGTVLSSWITGPVPAFGECCTYQAFVPNVQPINLVGQQRYWILAVANGFSSTLIWNSNSLGLSGPSASMVNGGPYTTGTTRQGAFQVLGTATVPEVSSTALSMTGLVFLAWQLRRSKSGS